MRVHKPIGSKERLFEMFENVNKIKIMEGFQVVYSDGVRQSKNFSQKNDALNFSRNEIKNNPKLREISVFRDDTGFHSTSQDEYLISWWGADGSYWDNISKKRPELLDKKMDISVEESFDSPKPKDKKYLDKTSGSEDSQVSKYDGGVDYPAINDLKVNDPALEKVAENKSKLKENQDSNNQYLNLIKSFLSSNNLDGGDDHFYSYQGYEIFVVPYIEEYNYSSGTKGDYMQPDDPDDFEITEVGFKQAGVYTDNGDELYIADKNTLSQLNNEFGKSVKISGDLAERMNEKGYEGAADDYSHGLAFGESKENIDEWEFEQRVPEKPDWLVHPDKTEFYKGYWIFPTVSIIHKRNGENFEYAKADEDTGYSDYKHGACATVEDCKNEIDSLISGVSENENSLSDIMDTIAPEKLEGGLGDDANILDFDPVQISKGIKIEMEHTNDPKVALEITMDHLTEMPDYYDHLEDMEANAEEEHSCGCGGKCGCGDEDSPEDKLLDPSTHWVDHYVPKNMGEDIEYPQTPEDAEARDRDYDEMEKLKRGELDDNYIPAMNEDSSTDIEIYDELEMRYSPTMKTIPHNDISDVAQMYDIDEEDVAQIAAQVIADQMSGEEDELKENMKDLISRMRENDLNFNEYSPKSIWEVFEHEYEMGISYNDFRRHWDKLTKDPNQMKLFNENNNSKIGELKYNYSDGNFIPVGHEDKKIALRPVEQPLGSGNNKVLLVSLGETGKFDNVIDQFNSWDEAKKALELSIN